MSLRKPPIVLSEDALKALDRDYYQAFCVRRGNDRGYDFNVFQVGTGINWMGLGEIPQSNGNFICYGANFSHEETSIQISSASAGKALIAFRRIGDRNFLMSHLYDCSDEGRTYPWIGGHDVVFDVKQTLSDRLYDIARTRGVIIDISQIALARELGLIGREK